MAKEIPAKVYASPEALALHKSAIVFDCLSLAYQLDPVYVDYALQGGVTATNVTMATEGQSWEAVLENIDEAYDKIAKQSSLKLATTAQDIRDAKRDGKLAVILGMQGSDSIGKKLQRVRFLHRLGIRYIGLAYTGATLLGDGCGEIRDAGLTFLGKEFVEAVNELPMVLDLSHSGHRTRLEAAQLAKNPVCTHSNSYTVNPNDRNTKDEVAKVIASKNGVMGVTALVRAVAPKDSTIEHMLDHAEHWIKTVGVERTGIGLDFTEGLQDEYRAGRPRMPTHPWRRLRPDIFGTAEEFFTQPYPDGMQSIRFLPNFTHGLLERGYSPEQVRYVMGEAWLNHFQRVVG